MASTPRVSIGLPVFNGDAYLEEALRSILGQTYEGFELIISDNGSTDRTASICRQFAREDPRIFYERHEKNRGAAWNYNRVFRKARGEYFRWAAHDDVIRSNYLESCTSVLDRNADVAVCYPRTEVIDAKGHHLSYYEDDLDLTSADPAERFRGFLDLYVTHGSECNAVFGLMRSDVLSETSLIGRYPSSDMILLGELALRGKIFEVNEPLFGRRDHSNTSVRSHKPYQERAAWFDPDLANHVILPRFRWWREYHRAIVQSPLSRATQMKLLVELHSRFLWNNGKYLVKDLLVGARQWRNRLPFAVSSSSRR